MIGDNQRARGGFEAGLGFQDANATPALSNLSGSEKASSGAAHNHYFIIVPLRAGLPLRSCHSVRSSIARGVWTPAIVGYRVESLDSYALANPHGVCG
jgi:hypothetical protein